MIGIALGLKRVRHVPAPFATTQWQLSFKQWQTITTIWN